MMRAQKWVFWFQPVLIASWILNVFLRHGVIRWLYASLVLVMIPALVYSVMAQRRSIRNWEARSTRSGGGVQEPVTE
jgi:hypothetical protein